MQFGFTNFLLSQHYQNLAFLIVLSDNIKNVSAQCQ